MKISRTSFGAAVVGIGVLAALTLVGVAGAKGAGPSGTAKPPKPEPAELGKEVLEMCGFCDKEELPKGKCNQYALTGCTYPPCSGPDATRYTFGPPDTKLACAACRAMCPFSPSKPKSGP
jgi:hypothetical protein